MSENINPLGGASQNATKNNTNAPKKKSNRGLVLGLTIGGGVLLIGIIVTVLILVLGGGGIKNLDDLQVAIRDRKAINCLVEQNGNSATIQATEGWGSIRISGKQDGGSKVDVLAIEGDSIYMVQDEMAMKMDYASEFADSMIDSWGVDTDSSGDLKIECSSPSESDFSVPDREWESGY